MGRALARGFGLEAATSNAVRRLAQRPDGLGTVFGLLELDHLTVHRVSARFTEPLGQ